MELDHESYTLGRAELSSDYSSLDHNRRERMQSRAPSKIEATKTRLENY
jgi:hypothetical protein